MGHYMSPIQVFHNLAWDPKEINFEAPLLSENLQGITRTIKRINIFFHILYSL